MKQVDCAIVIVTYNSVRDVPGLLDSLPAAVGSLSTQVIVVDNGSTDGTLDVIRRDYPSVVCVTAPGNLGYAGGINLGRRTADDFKWLLVLNPDMRLDADSIEQMTAAFTGDDVGIVVPMLLDDAGNRYPSLRRDPTLLRALGDALLGDHLGWRPSRFSEIVRSERDYSREHVVDWATGAVFLISATCDAKTGDWDEQFFLYSEEVDYAARARAAGFSMKYLPTVKAWHRGGGSGQSDSLTALMAVNRILYMEKLDQSRGAFRAVVALHEFLRSGESGHRVALRWVVARRSGWAELSAGLRGQPTGVRPPVLQAELRER